MQLFKTAGQQPALVPGQKMGFSKHRAMSAHTLSSVDTTTLNRSHAGSFFSPRAVQEAGICRGHQRHVQRIVDAATKGTEDRRLLFVVRFLFVGGLLYVFVPAVQVSLVRR